MGNENIHPAHKEVLDVIPAEFHHLVIPTLQKWDKGVQERFQEIHNQYEPLKAYESFVKNNIDAEYAEQAVLLADQLQREPGKVLEQVNKAWNLGYVSADEAAKLGSHEEPNEDFVLDGEDIFKDPRVKAMKESLETLQQQFEQEKKAAEEEADLAEFEAYLNQLEQDTKAKNLPFHRDFVTALMSQGLDGEDAVKQYHQVLAGTVNIEDVGQQTENPAAPPAPPVMGAEGTNGSGTPDGSVAFGTLSKNQLNSTIEQMLSQSMNSGQG